MSTTQGIISSVKEKHLAKLNDAFKPSSNTFVKSPYLPMPLPSKRKEKRDTDTSTVNRTNFAPSEKVARGKVAQSTPSNIVAASIRKAFQAGPVLSYQTLNLPPIGSVKPDMELVDKAMKEFQANKHRKPKAIKMDPSVFEYEADAWEMIFAQGSL